MKTKQVLCTEETHNYTGPNRNMHHIYNKRRNSMDWKVDDVCCLHVSPTNSLRSYSVENGQLLQLF